MSKPLDRLTLLQTFVRIADAGSISAAARDLGLSQPSASRQLAELEARLKTQLVRRNTHSMSLTRSGTELLAESRALLESWDALEEKHLASEGQIVGALKLVAPVALGQLELARIAWRFQLAHPGVSLDWLLDDQPIRFSELGCDCWIKVGEIPDDTLVVRDLGRVERLLVGSTGFIESSGAPGTPKAAAAMPLLGLTPFEGGKIPLENANGRSSTISPPLKMRTNNIVALKEAALLGLGMAVLPRWFVDAELRDGSLANVLPGWRAPALSIRAAYLPGRYRPRRLRAFVDALEKEVPEIPGIAAPD
ncbi:MAG: LysR family transcriptional regulator [Pseudomonadota bacterium]